MNSLKDTDSSVITTLAGSGYVRTSACVMAAAGASKAHSSKWRQSGQSRWMQA